MVCCIQLWLYKTNFCLSPCTFGLHDMILFQPLSLLEEDYQTVHTVRQSAQEWTATWQIKVYVHFTHLYSYFITHGDGSKPGVMEPQHQPCSSTFQSTKVSWFSPTATWLFLPWQDFLMFQDSTLLFLLVADTQAAKFGSQKHSHSSKERPHVAA